MRAGRNRQIQMNKDEVGIDEKESALPDPVPDLVAERSSMDDTRPSEGSVGYRIAAMVAMFLLALATLVFWYYAR
jgi:hypothetical protein